MNTSPRLLRNIIQMLTALVTLAASIGCESTPATAPATSPAGGTAPAALATAAPGTPGAQRAAETPTSAAPCTVPAFAEQLALTSLPGTVRDPIGLATIGGRLYVSGRLSNNLGIVDGDKLAQIVPLDFGPTQLLADEPRGRLYTADPDRRSIAQFEGTQLRATLVISNPLLASYQQIGGMALDAPHERLYALMNGETSAIAVIDTRAFTLTRWISLTGWRTATRLTLDPAGTTLYLGGYNRIEVIDPVAGTELRSIPLPSPSYQVLVLDPVTGRLFVDQYENGAYIGVIENDTIVARIPVGTDVNDGLIAGRRLYVSAAYSSTVNVIDPQSLQTVAVIPVGTGPRVLAADSSGGRVYVGIEGIYQRETNRVDVIDTRTNTVSKLIPLMGQPSQMLADETRGRLYALMPSSNELLISDGRRVLSSVPLERSPSQMALDEAGGRLYVTDWQTGHVSVVDVVNARVLEQRSLVMPWRLNAIAVDSRNRQLVVNTRTYALDTLAETGFFSVTGYTVPFGNGINPDYLLANASAARLYAVASNGVPGSNGGITLYSIDSAARRQLSITGERNILGIALDDGAQRLYATGTHPLAGGTSLFVYDAVTMTRTQVIPMQTLVRALALNPRTNHLFAAYSVYRYALVQPSRYTNQLDVLDTRTLGRVTTIPVGADPTALAVLGDRVFVAHGSGRALSVIRDCPVAAPAAPTPTVTPSPYPTIPPPPTPAATPLPTAAPRRTSTPTATPTPLAACKVPLAPWLQAPGSAEGDARAKLGCPIEPSRIIQLARQNFEKGVMFWRADTHQIYVILSDGSWMAYADTWDTSQPEGGTEKPPRPELFAPKRGFGKVWREQLGGTSAAIGWGIEEERALTGEIQPFERGQALRDGTGPVWLVGIDGTWR